MDTPSLHHLVNEWYRDGRIHHAAPLIEDHRLVGFTLPPELHAFDGTPEEAVRLLRVFNAAKSNFYSTQLLHPKSHATNPRRLLPEYRKERPSRSISPDEIATCHNLLQPLQVGEKLDLAHHDTRARVVLALRRAAAALGYEIAFRAGLKGVVRLVRTA